MSHINMRAIDREPKVTKREKEMKVLVLGMSRTGTFSIYTALQQLGYHPYHMAEAMKDPKRQLPLWEDAVNAKYRGIGNPFGRAELDKILSNFDAVADMPCALLIDEMIAAYPNAKVVLTNRDVDKWLVSMQNTAFKVVSWPTWRYLAPFDSTMVGPWWHFAECLLGAWPGKPFNATARQKYLEHYAYVRKVVPEANLLEFKSEDGFGPLCAFLGDEVPSFEYPNINDSNNFVWQHTLLWFRGLIFAVVKILGACAPLMALVFAYSYMKR